MPGDTIRYENDKLYINDKETDESYLAGLHQTLQGWQTPKHILVGVGFEGNKGTFFRSIAEKPKPLQLMSTIYQL